MSDQPQMTLRAFERSREDTTKVEAFRTELNNIKVKPGFNPRDMTKPETIAKIDGIYDSYVAGRYVPNIIASFTGSHFEIVDGECRFTAAIKADAYLKSIGKPGIKLTVTIFKGNDLDKMLFTIHGNNGERLLPIEICEPVKAMFNQGLDSTKIEEHLGYSRQWVAQLLQMANMPEQVKALVRAGKIASDVALNICAENTGDGKALAILEAMLGKKNGERVTKKDLPKKLSPIKQAYAHVQTIAAILPPPDMATDEMEDDQMYALQLNGKAFKALAALHQFAPKK